MAPVKLILPEHGASNPRRSVRPIVLPEPQPVALVHAADFERRVEQLGEVLHLEITVQDAVLAETMEIDGDDGIAE
jgi:hypothetical protein